MSRVFFFPENSSKYVNFFCIEHTCVTDPGCMFSIRLKLEGIRSHLSAGPCE